MKLKTLSSIAGLALIGVIVAPDPGSSFTSVRLETFTASVTLNAAGTGGPVTLNIPSALQAQTLAFFGKNVVIPLQLQGTSGSVAQFQQKSNASAAVTMQYQMFNIGGSAVGGVLTVPVSFQPTGQATILAGNAIIPVQNIEALRHGGSLALSFAVQNGNQTIQYNAPSGAPYRIQFIDTLTQAVDPVQGSIVTVPDPELTDGKTQLVFAPGALSGPGTVVIHQLDPISVSGGPGGLLPLSAYTFELQNTTLQRTVAITMTYPNNLDGSLIGSNGNPANLAPYWLQGSNWLVLDPHQWNSTMHTVSVTSPHFSTFALFLSAGFSGADLRPKHRILTPNGDNINDTIDFSGIDPQESVHIFNVRGRRIRTLSPSNSNLQWNGTDDNGRIVESGIYIYQYTSQGERVSGVILVVK